MYADDTTYEVVPVWQNRLQAMMYEDNLHVRISHYSYEIRNNRIKLYPTPTGDTSKMWFEFSVEQDNMFDAGRGTNAGSQEELVKSNIGGVNNINTLPFANIPYENINSIGKHWIRNYSLALCKEILGYVRSKFSNVPIPGDNITLNGDALLAEAKAEKERLKAELKEILETTTYAELAKTTKELTDASFDVWKQVPMPIFFG